MTLKWINGEYVWTMDPAELITIHSAIQSGRRWEIYQRDEWGRDYDDRDTQIDDCAKILEFLKTERPKTLRKDDPE